MQEIQHGRGLFKQGLGQLMIFGSLNTALLFKLINLGEKLFNFLTLTILDGRKDLTEPLCGLVKF